MACCGEYSDTPLRKGVARMLQDDGFAYRVQAEFSAHTQSHSDPLARCRALNSWLSTGAVWKEEGHKGGNSVTKLGLALNPQLIRAAPPYAQRNNKDTDVGSSKNRRNQPERLHEDFIGCKHASETAVDSDAAFDILSLLSALSEPTVLPPTPEDRREPTGLEGKSTELSAEWLLLDVIDSLEEPELTTLAAASSPSSMDSRPPFEGGNIEMVPLLCTQIQLDAMPRTQDHHEHNPCGTEEANMCQLAHSESYSGVAQERANGREMLAPEASGAGSRGFDANDADLMGNYMAQGPSHTQQRTSKYFGRASNHVRQCLELTKIC